MDFPLLSASRRHIFGLWEHHADLRSAFEGLEENLRKFEPEWGELPESWWTGLSEGLRETERMEAHYRDLLASLVGFPGEFPSIQEMEDWLAGEWTPPPPDSGGGEDVEVIRRALPLPEEGS